MVAYSTIVTGSDGSDSSLHAVRSAASLARAFQAKLIIVSAFYQKNGLMIDAKADANALPVINRDAAEDILLEAQQVATDEGAGHIELRALNGGPVAVLRDVVEESAADLVVIGNRGLKTLSGRVFGSIPSEVTRRFDVDVLVVNSDHHEQADEAQA
ncbi:universal stress protein [Corynebacterium pseudodiphtheriticum]|uniref:universal stress protein n=1 Tax=Corynebacterium pseudodiphtheriticum TaxID=37637 RepID=UPI0020BFEED0|nr:universal stress protein [Corynebacterium pseudodiphtheriticum]MDK8613946.1 universal stress protein [Corynebacterium pseudodiphtheriticum]MDK8717903.1 universal stress protein [Corynebacterium pseudodiphtheriticum]MDK8737882.1 universal stress protein [Corynebacterium pseudodiphtheriticum]MDK8744168.1 universal stress protein [Corynebacterium pseudodiphtheriticum]MDK8761432.1 universal stress protein [Corynebacterium pseudodiphtheriticum]